MSTNSRNSTSNSAPGAGERPANGAAEPRVREHIELMLAQTHNPQRLRTVQHLMARPGSRVFVPQSDAGLVLFMRLLDLDAAYAAVARKLWRSGNAEALGRKQALEADLMQVNRTLIQVVATMAVEHGIEDSRFEAATVAVIRALKAQRAAAAAPRHSAVETAAPPTGAASSAASSTLPHPLASLESSTAVDRRAAAPIEAHA